MPRPAKNLTLEQRIEIARRYAAGETAKALAEAFGISPRHVNRLAREEAGDGVAVRDPSQIVAFRASSSELEAFDAEWQARGFANRSQALHAMLRARCGFLDVPRDLIVAFSETCRQAQDVTDAGRTLAKAVHRGKLVLFAEDLATLSALLDTAQVMSRELAAMKEAARQQRGQGWPKPDTGVAPDRVETAPAASGGEARRKSVGQSPVEEELAADAISEARADTPCGRSGSELNHPSLPLGKPRTQRVIHDTFLKNRNTRYG